MVARGLVVCAALGLAGCSLNVNYTGTTFQCNDDGACPDGYACVSDQCILTGTAAPAPTCTTALGTGVSHACAIRDDGTAWCWGSNNAGQLGDGTTIDRTSPVEVAATGLPKLTAIAGGLVHTCAIGADKTVWCWGANDLGQLGNAAKTGSPSPVAVAGITAATAIAAGDHHTCVIDNGNVKCWGDNALAQIGDGSVGGARAQPVTSQIGAGVTAIAAGGDSTCAITSMSTVQCWGNAGQGQLGIGAGSQAGIPPVTALTPTTMELPASDASATSVAIGQNFACAATQAGNVYCSGFDASHQLGIPDDPSLRITPVQIPLAVSATKVIAGDQFACAIDDQKHLWCWGQNTFGQLGNGASCDGDFSRSSNGLCDLAAPVLANYTDALDASAGHGFLCVKSTDGLHCNGDNGLAQLGNGERDSNPTPTPVKGVAGVAELALGESFSCARLGDGTAKCWGLNDHGQLGDGSTVTRTQPVSVVGLTGATKLSVGQGHACALVAGGKVMCWGRNDFGQLGDGTVALAGDHGEPRFVLTDKAKQTALSGATDLTAGVEHTCAIVNGSAMCWGSNDTLQLGIAGSGNHPLPVTAVLGTGTPPQLTEISAGDAHTCALDQQHNVWCWGSNNVSQLGLASGSTCAAQTSLAPGEVSFAGITPAPVITHVATRDGFSCAYSADAVWCWGFNGDGELGNLASFTACKPQQISGLVASQLAVGQQSTCALPAAGGGPECWGANFRGQIGVAAYSGALHDQVYSLYPSLTPVTGLANVSSIAAGARHACAVLADQSVTCWGDDGDGELGDGVMRRTAPVAPALQCPQAR